MNADLYAAWLTAGNNLQPVGAWIGANWTWLLPAVAAAAFACWSIPRAIRRANHTIADALGELDQHRTADHTREGDTR